METVSVKSLFASPDAHVGGEICVRGWLRTLRVSKRMGFLELNDGSFFKNLQVVFEEGTGVDFSQTARLGVGAAVICRGELVLTPGARQPFELRASGIESEGVAPSDYPLQKKRHSLEFLRTVAHLRPRTNTFSAVFRVRSEAAYALHSFMRDNGFVYVNTPIITASDCEGAGQMFRVTTLPPGEQDVGEDFFGKAANLTVSGQLEAECFALAFGRAYTFGPAFRAEDSNTARHAAEFWMLEPEMAFADVEDDMDMAEAMVKAAVRHILGTLPEEMEFFDQHIAPGLPERLAAILDEPFSRITYTQAVDILAQAKAEFQYPVVWGEDLHSEHERYLTEQVFGKPVFVTDYPKEIKAFYMRRNDDDRTVAAMDLLVPGVGELIGGSQREERLDVLSRRLEEAGIDPEAYWWYLDLRRYGSARHAGFGLGFERFIMYVTGMANIRDVIPFARTPRNAEF